MVNTTIIMNVNINHESLTKNKWTWTFENQMALDLVRPQRRPSGRGGHPESPRRFFFCFIPMYFLKQFCKKHPTVFPLVCFFFKLKPFSRFFFFFFSPQLTLAGFSNVDVTGRRPVDDASSVGALPGSAAGAKKLSFDS